MNGNKSVHAQSSAWSHSYRDLNEVFSSVHVVVGKVKGDKAMYYYLKQK